MKMQQTSEYQIRVHLDLSYEQALEQTTAALQNEGFGILTEIDIEATMKKKLDAEFRKYTILGACNPSLAYQALNTELEVGLLLPCNVIVYEDESGGSVVSIIDPLMMLHIAQNEGLESVATEAKSRLQRVAKALDK